jgi:hypothetical protein
MICRHIFWIHNMIDDLPRVAPPASWGKVTTALRQGLHRSMTSVPWQATARRRRWILKRYGKGPRKKPPDPPPERPKRIHNTTHHPTQLRQPRRHRRRIKYKRSLRSVSTPSCTTHAPAPFLAGHRRCYNKISPRYWHTARTLLRSGSRHGSILQRVSQKAKHLLKVLTTTFHNTLSFMNNSIRQFYTSSLLKARQALQLHLTSPPPAHTLESISEPTAASKHTSPVPTLATSSNSNSQLWRPSPIFSQISKTTSWIGQRLNHLQHSFSLLMPGSEESPSLLSSQSSYCRRL